MVVTPRTRTQVQTREQAGSMKSDTRDQWYRIGDVAALTGVSPRALRAWEERHGLLHPCRSPGGNRLYSHEDIERVRYIMRAVTEHGASLRTIAAQLLWGETMPAPDQPAHEHGWRARGTRRHAGSTSLAPLAESQQYRQLLEAASRFQAAVTLVASVEQMLTILCQEACALFDVTSSVVWLVDASRQVLTGAAGHGAGTEPFLHYHHPLERPSLVTACARQQRIIVGNNLQTHPSADRRLNMLSGAAAILAAPLVTATGNVLGVLVLQEARNPERFTREDVALVECFAAQAIVALANAQSFVAMTGLCALLMQRVHETGSRGE